MSIGRQRHYIREQDGSVRPASVMKWLEHDSFSTYRIDETYLGDGVVRVSTVFLGIDHQFGDGPPLIYETMVFVEQPADEALIEAMDMHCERYSTEAEARAGHERIVKMARALVAELRR